MKFRLAKWYLDCVSADGNLFIGYAASLSVGAIPLHLVGRVTMIDGKVRQEAAATWADQAPTETGAELTWRCQKLELVGTWKARLPSATKTIFERDEGRVVWHCAQPLADASVVWSGNARLRGLGYAERLEMDIGPLDMGLTRLHWGRFLSDDTSLVWIKWTGKESRLIVFHNGAEMPGASLENDRLIVGKELHLQWNDSVPIRTGQLKDSVLPSLPLLKKVLPDWIGRITEHKWRSRGKLMRGDNPGSDGWVIHEEVIFEDRTQKGLAGDI